MSEFVGKVLGGRYRVDAFLGRGGMADVYKVWDQQRAVFLAIKVLRSEISEDVVFLRRFEREAQTLERLQHPHIVRFYGIEKADGLAFILMDYVDGPTLRKEIFQSQGQGMSLPRILEVMRPICSALHYAHQSGLVHCDIKPANLMMQSNGTMLVSDFGIARATETSTSTMAGAGTPAYMAPEQIQGKEPTAQTDVYALGVVLYEMLTGGERPFTGELANTTGTTMQKVIWEKMHLEPPSPRVHRSELSETVESVVIKCLQIDPEARYTSALAVYTALDHAIRGENAPEESTLIEPLQTATRPAAPAAVTKVSTGSQARLPKWAWVAVGGVALLLLAMVWGALSGTSTALPTETAIALQTEPIPIAQTSATPPTTEVAPTADATVTIEPSATLEPTSTFTPEPTGVPTPMGGGWGQVAFVSTRGGNPQIWLMNSDGSNQMPLTNIGLGACQPTWSADGMKLAYISPCTGSGIRETYPKARVYIFDLQTKESLQIASTSESDYQPAWSPDGKTIAFSAVFERQTVIALYDVASGTRTDLTMRGGKNIFPAWSPDSQQIVYIATTSGSEVLWLMQADGSGQRLYIPIETKVRYENPSWSADGSTIVFTKIGGGVAVSRLYASPVSSEGAVEVALSEDLLPRTDVSYSSDGLWLVFDAWLDGSNHDIYIAPPDDLTAARQLTTNTANDFHPTWRPTGTPAP